VYKRLRRSFEGPTPSISEQFGVRSSSQLARDLRKVLTHLTTRDRYVLDPSALGHFRPTLSLPAYAGLMPTSGVSPIMNFFDRFGGGRGFRATVTKRTARDYRGGKLTYDEHDGTDFVCPPGLPVVAAAPGVLVAARDTFLRGGLTACVDHGGGVVTQYTHLTRILADVGQPLRRGETFAWSGSAGLDMLSGFPWVPPHVHFMVWVNGVPVDPYRRPGEEARPGAWLHGNDPQTSGELPDDPRPPAIDDIGVDEPAMAAVIERCGEPRIRDEMWGAKHRATRAALLEDSLHHDRDAWPEGLFGAKLRPPSDASHVRLTLPLTREQYRSARPVDNVFTRPRAA
jgi:murein DD-endopeptidase MepM/ murein hydrolase activator NlpD